MFTSPILIEFLHKMAPETLYIIGNGFDLHHGLKSQYIDFKEYLEDTNSELLDKLEKYFWSDELWSEFEETLALLETEEIVDECLNYLEPYSAEDWSDSYHHDYQYEVQLRIDIITIDLKKYFTEWILQLKIPKAAKNKTIGLKPKSIFINFNYTDTLEKLYRISSDQILYVHNKAINSNSILILGHSRDPKKNKRIAEIQNDEDTDVRVAEGNEILDSYFEKTYKSTEKIILESCIFFEQLCHVKEIYILGHSLSEVDIPYLKEIIKNIDMKEVQWKISAHSNHELIHHKEEMNKLGIDLDLIEFGIIDDFDSSQLTLFQKTKL